MSPKVKPVQLKANRIVKPKPELKLGEAELFRSTPPSSKGQSQYATGCNRHLFFNPKPAKSRKSNRIVKPKPKPKLDDEAELFRGIPPFPKGQAQYRIRWHPFFSPKPTKSRK